MITYKMIHDWEISVPDNWTEEIDAVDGHYLFYPDNSDLTVHVTPFFAERDGIPVPAEFMENLFTGILSSSAVPRSTVGYAPKGFTGKISDSTVIENGKTVYVINIGYFSDGELLSVGIFGTSRNECEQCTDILATIKKV